MASGLITWSNGGTETVGGATCDAVRASLSYSFFPMYTVQSCSTDPVAAATVITLKPSSGSAFNLTVSSITATSPVATASATFDTATASGLWGFAFCSVVGLYLFSLKVATMLRLIRGRG